MELHHFLIDTDSLGERIYALKQSLMPDDLDDDTWESANQEVDEALKPLLETDLQELMGRVEDTARNTVAKALQDQRTAASSPETRS